MACSQAKENYIDPVIECIGSVEILYYEKAGTHIINDDVDAAEAGLSRGNSSYHKLGRGIVIFIKATLGFEQDVMREAYNCLADAETTATEDYRRAQRQFSGNPSSNYPPGSEFALCQAQAQLMSAVVAVLSESLTESLKGFYKLRKAYMTLHGIMEVESKISKENGGLSASNTEKNSIRSIADTKSRPTSVRSRQEDEEEEFYDATETHQGAQKNGETSENGVPEKGMAALKLDSEESRHNSDYHDVARNGYPSQQGSDSHLFSNPIDLFIHSGSNLCFGLLLLMISMIPPAFGKLLSIIGFRGDRQRGLEMLWQASSLPHVHGAMSGLVLLGFYNGIVGFCDILPDDSDENIEGYPKRRCEGLLVDMRKQYPKSRLWMLEEARMLAANRQLEEAVDLLSGDISSQLKQIEAFAMFEKSLNLMYLHRYELASEAFLKCVDLNNWSHALYYYIAGSAEIEVYRKLIKTDPDEAAKHAKVGVKLLKKVPAHTGKKRIMARQLPFDTFVLRKIQKWEHRAQQWKIDFVDAIGVSPIEEMIYLWNGYKRMPSYALQDSFDVLSWSNVSNPHWHREDLDEQAIHSLLRASTLRSLGEYDEARRILQDEVLSHDKQEFKGHLKDDWTCPSAHYEMAVICWMERKRGSSEEYEKERLKECAEWLEKAARWESYDLDARIGLKVTTAQDTLKKYNIQ
ncbi:MAG: Mitochondrial outer membrane protein iml2 [Peltula sp. TS41687]|nr:MAG: Mitochondrial outer membrane protein iml2 [Peltula sp. TS41687]